MDNNKSKVENQNLVKVENQNLVEKFLNKKTLSLFSGALISVAGTMAIQNDANAADLTLGVAEEWRDGTNDTDEVTGLASANDNVNLVTFTLTVDDTGDSTAIFDITGSSGDLVIKSEGNDVDVTHTINSINLTSTGNIDINQLEADNSTMIVTVTDQLTTEGYLKITSTEDSAADNVILDLDGNVAVTADSTFTADVGAGAGGNVQVNLAGATVTFTAGFNMVDNTGTVTINVDGTSDQTITGLIDGGGANNGTINVSQTSGTVTFASNIGATQPLLEIEIDASANVILSGVTKVKDLDLDGTVTLSENANILGNGIAWADGGKVIIDDTIVAGEDVFNVLADATAVASGATVELPANFVTGTITLLDTGHDISADVANITVTDTAIYNYAIANVTGDETNSDAHMTVSINSDSTVKSNLSLDHLNEAKILKQAHTALVSEGGSTLDKLTTRSNTSTSDAAIKELAQEAGTQADTLNAQTQSVSTANMRTLTINSQRLASLRDGKNFPTGGVSGFNAGSEMSNRSAFIKAFGNVTDQDKSGGVLGYSSDVVGFQLGFDGITDKGSRVGVSYTRSNNNIDGDGYGKSQIDVESHQLAFYTDYSTDTYYIEGQIGIGSSGYDASRKVVISNLSLDRTIKGAFDGLLGTVALAVGKPIPKDAGVWVTPRGALTFLKSRTKGYTETGGTNLNQKVEEVTRDSLIGNIGLNIDKIQEKENSTINTQLRLGVSYDLLDEAIEISSKFVDTGSSYITSVDTEPLSANIGLGLSAIFGTFELGINADTELKDSSQSHTATLSLKIKY